MPKLNVGDWAPPIAAADGKGAEVDLARMSAGGRVLLVFLRHLGCPLCREIIADLGRLYPDAKAAGGEIVALTESTPERVRSFTEKSAVPFHLVSDREKKYFADYGVVEGSIAAMLGPKAFAATLRATFKGHLHGRFEGSELQLPADFIVAESRIELAHYGKDVSDHLPAADLIARLKKQPK